jgi:hypothetical protein
MSQFTYYHGTSTIFAYSIREYGLGTINPNIKYRNLDLLRHLYNLAEQYLLDEKDYLKLRITTTAMASQCTQNVIIDSFGNSQIQNYRHTNMYVSLHIFRAVVYASNNIYGSEILERCITLYKLLKIRMPNFELPTELNIFSIEKLVSSRPEPIIVEVNNIDPNIINTENGEPASLVLKQLRVVKSACSEKEWHDISQFSNFELLQPVPPENLKFHRLIFSGSPKDQENFNWSLEEW